MLNHHCFHGRPLQSCKDRNHVCSFSISTEIVIACQPLIGASFQPLLNTYSRGGWAMWLPDLIWSTTMVCHSSGTVHDTKEVCRPRQPNVRISQYHRAYPIYTHCLASKEVFGYLSDPVREDNSYSMLERPRYKEMHAKNDDASGPVFSTYSLFHPCLLLASITEAICALCSAD